MVPWLQILCWVIFLWVIRHYKGFDLPRKMICYMDQPLEQAHQTIWAIGIESIKLLIMIKNSSTTLFFCSKVFKFQVFSFNETFDVQIAGIEHFVVSQFLLVNIDFQDMSWRLVGDVLSFSWVWYSIFIDVSGSPKNICFKEAKRDLAREVLFGSRGIQWKLARFWRYANVQIQDNF